jgi:hypothetical protein
MMSRFDMFRQVQRKRSPGRPDNALSFGFDGVILRRCDESLTLAGQHRDAPANSHLCAMTSSTGASQTGPIAQTNPLGASGKNRKSDKKSGFFLEANGDHA